ncbi:MAG: hypothetical protein LBQ38_13910 [Spirochaetaceae bacterium]|jgi:hypothetical protein|nr:hypothetical protein [Spirochaetaceae bacterium]
MKEYRDEIAMICHEIVIDGHRLGLVSDAEMREFEENCFVSTSEPAKEVPVTVEAGHPAIV